MRNAEVLSAKVLLEEAGSPIVPETLFRSLERVGLIEKRTYLSSTGSGEVKSFWAFTQSGLKYGVNKPTFSPTKTDLRFFRSTFHELLAIAAQAITDHAEEVAQRRLCNG